MVKLGNLTRNNKGQTTVEYILLLGVIASLIALFYKALGDMQLADSFMQPLTGDFTKLYRYGHKKTKGPSEGGPEHHVRFVGGNNFRIFMKKPQ